MSADPSQSQPVYPLHLAADLRFARVHDARFSDRPVLLGDFSCFCTPGNARADDHQVVLLLILEMSVSSLIVTAILKGNKTGFRKTDRLMKKIAM